jgi:hypothetical protein
MQRNSISKKPGFSPKISSDRQGVGARYIFGMAFLPVAVQEDVYFSLPLCCFVVRIFILESIAFVQNASVRVYSASVLVLALSRWYSFHSSSLLTIFQTWSLVRAVRRVPAR